MNKFMKARPAYKVDVSGRVPIKMWTKGVQLEESDNWVSPDDFDFVDGPAT